MISLGVSSCVQVSHSKPRIILSICRANIMYAGCVSEQEDHIIYTRSVLVWFCCFFMKKQFFKNLITSSACSSIYFPFTLSEFVDLNTLEH